MGLTGIKHARVKAQSAVRPVVWKRSLANIQRGPRIDRQTIWFSSILMREKNNTSNSAKISSKWQWLARRAVEKCKLDLCYPRRWFAFSAVHICTVAEAFGIVCILDFASKKHAGNMTWFYSKIQGFVIVSFILSLHSAVWHSLIFYVSHICMLMD